jgi:hypothetical protein
MRTLKTAGQEPLATGSRMATHSTWCVITNMCNESMRKEAAAQKPALRKSDTMSMCITCRVGATCKKLQWNVHYNASTCGYAPHASEQHRLSTGRTGPRRTFQRLAAGVQAPVFVPVEGPRPHGVLQDLPAALPGAAYEVSVDVDHGLDRPVAQPTQHLSTDGVERPRSPWCPWTRGRASCDFYLDATADWQWTEAETALVATSTPPSTDCAPPVRH